VGNVIRTLAARHHLFRLTQLRRRQRGPAAETLTATFRGRKTGNGSLAQHIMFELCDGAEHSVQHSPRGGAGVDMIGE